MPPQNPNAPANAASMLDPRERHVILPHGEDGLRLFLRYLPPTQAPSGPPRVALHVHGATFPSALSIAHRFDGQSWRDSLCARGFHVWGFDFLGFGGSDRYPEMQDPADRHPALGRAAMASRQLATVVHFLCEQHGVARVSLIAHSWGSIVAGHFAAREPAAVERLVMFGPICRRDGPPAMTLPAWRLVSLDDQWRRFVADVPAGETPVLSRRHFDPWGEAYLDSDPASRHRTPPSVQIPNGPAQDIADAWGGRLAYDPAAVRAPVLILRGAWDSLVTDGDAHGLFAALTGASPRRDVKLSGGTHLMHLEAGRFALYRETETFLLGET